MDQPTTSFDPGHNANRLKRSSSPVEPLRSPRRKSERPLQNDSNDKLDKAVLETASLAPTSRPLATFLLATIVSTSEGLNRDYGFTQNAKTLLEEHPDLLSKLQEAWETRSFNEIRNLEILRSTIPDKGSLGFRLQGSSPLPLEPERPAHKAWSDKWLGDSHVLLATLMDRLHQSTPPLKPYNHSISIIQSSGMGKSRLMDAVAQMKFCFPFNMREPNPRGQFAYPPSDCVINEFFREPRVRSLGDDKAIERRYISFFVALFECAVPELQLALNSIPATEGPISKRWRKYLASEATEYAVGKNRETFYQKVTALAEKYDKAKETLENIDEALQFRSADFELYLQSRLSSSMNDVDNHLAKSEVSYFMYFDEAHILTQISETQPPPRSKYHLFGRVLAMMNLRAFFAVFLSTNSWLGAFAPSTSRIPSLRDWDNTILHAPFTELPYDTFANDSFGHLSRANPKGVLLQHVCTLEYAIKFGRPLWASLYECGSTEVKSGMVDLATMKLSCGDSSNEYARTASLSVRIILDFDTAREISRAYEEKLVESHMRVVFCVPQHREFLRSGTPSEPLLAEAAAQILNNCGRFQDEGPELLAKSMERGLLARGERGEMITRLLWTLAHDSVLSLHPRQRIDPMKLIFHQPILFLDWLKKLLNPHWHDVVLNARPIADPDGLPLKDAFDDVYLNFSHFARAGDYSVIGPELLWICLVRSMAYQCSDNQKSTDLVAALHHGGLHAPICSQNTSPMFCQSKDRQVVSQVLLNPHTGGTPLNDLPIFSMIMDVGLEKANVYPHPSIPAKALRETLVNRTKNIHIKHYQIHIEGCTHEVYDIIPPSASGFYRSMLRATTVCDDFPRNDFPGYRDAMIRLKPAIFGTEGASSLGWVDDATVRLGSHGSQSQAVESRVSKEQGKAVKIEQGSWRAEEDINDAEESSDEKPDTLREKKRRGKAAQKKKSSKR